MALNKTAQYSQQHRRRIRRRPKQQSRPFDQVCLLLLLNLILSACITTRTTDGFHLTPQKNSNNNLRRMLSVLRHGSAAAISQHQSSRSSTTSRATRTMILSRGARTTTMMTPSSSSSIAATRRSVGSIFASSGRRAYSRTIVPFLTSPLSKDSSRRFWSYPIRTTATATRLFSTAEAVRNGTDQEQDQASVPVITDELLSAAAEAPNQVPVNGEYNQPKPKGNWDVNDPLKWTKRFGLRSTEYEEELQSKIRLQPGMEGYYDVDDLKMPMVTIVRAKEDARKVLEKLNDPSHAGQIFHACDTEVMDIDLTKVGPVGNGFVTCISIYSGFDFDYGLGDPPGSVLWIDNLDDACDVLQEFKDWFENPEHLKVWHNYGFDRHVMWNEGINVQGFGGDTMHMARLQDTSRSKSALNVGAGGGNGYSLETLTHELIGRRKKPMKEIFGIRRKRKDGSEGLLVDLPPVEVMQRSPEFRKKWIEYSCYDAQGTWLIRNELEKKLRDLPWFTSEEGSHSLYDYYWRHMRPFGEVLTDMERRGIRVDAQDYLASVEEQARKDREYHSEKFREWAATKIGPDGLALNLASSVQLQTFLFGGALNIKTKEPTENFRVFQVPREEVPDDAIEAYRHQEEAAKKQAESNADTTKKDQIDYLDEMKVAQLKALCKECKLKISGKKADLQDRLREYFLNPPVEEEEEEEEPSNNASSGEDDIESMSDDDLRDALIGRGLSTAGSTQELIDRYRADDEFIKQVQSAQSSSNDGDKDDNSPYVLSEVLEEAAKKGSGVLSEFLEEYNAKQNAVPKYVDVTIRSIGLTPETFTAGGAPSVTAAVLRKLAGDPYSDPPKFGTAHDAVGEEGCEALASLCAIGSIDTMISNFLTSLQELTDSDSRVHCSLNLNTDTGRLSSRRPNLQNQPALEKDKYKIRKAFQASPGNNLIVADYGQLELRILASITHCQSMIDAFASGGDFHSRTAIDMFPYVKQAVEDGECLLEWDYSKGDQPPKPLLKDKFASERRKAKTLNFSIAYGKTAHGLSEDWGVTKKEAEGMLQAWYAARPEVLEWQSNTKDIARKDGITRTLMGRYRQLPGATGRFDRRAIGRNERASINTPIQGGAADIAMMAMIKINNSQKLKRLGWVLLLQIHDEVILEGPEETAEEAFEEVLKCMEEPWVFGLEKTAVPLVVDGSYTHTTWYDAK